jgi:multidrug transporter EmrE-like cation transporter
MGQINLKHHHGSDTKVFIYMILAFTCYFGISFLLSLSYNFEEIGLINNLWSALSIIMFTLFGYYYWNERVSMNNIIGIIIVLLGILLLVYNSYKNRN